MLAAGVEEELVAAGWVTLICVAMLMTMFGLDSLEDGQDVERIANHSFSFLGRWHFLLHRIARKRRFPQESALAPRVES
jgi:hypothetical protein